MAKNQRQRRPLQDETRQNKQTVRERAQASRRQRDRIEENRDRREQRRERQRLRRQTIDSVRSPKEDVRIDRFDSRMVPVEDTFLGRPVGATNDLPVVIGERWGINSNNQTFGSGSDGELTWEVSSFTTERNGYPALLYGGASSNTFRIPAGLAGVWQITYAATWAASSFVGSRTHTIIINGADTIMYYYFDGDTTSGIGFINYLFQEGDTFVVKALQDSGGVLDLVGSTIPYFTYLELIFAGK